MSEPKFQGIVQQCVGGPFDGGWIDLCREPRDCEEFDRKGHVYRYDLQKMRWQYVGCRKEPANDHGD